MEIEITQNELDALIRQNHVIPILLVGSCIRLQ